ncbi:sigma-54-dependent Fis family transcriptional regulator [Trinickia caryophylli]|uniref:Regulatory protein, Fis family n=1 Tax=Trinickia caryophylli TaxID=28094 RepID=A0A1X7GEC9_TRICW|nr:sigma-54-dependent Fis family transcriptional regulator [Trinickia caryophylli]PMS10765.1 sigma-54-dependent Fis family transcriptional regulator [Trinickia caryophylli]TRX13858.1 sigma-54-dependent Fis family transcriptional regulator [Trinickia caryophylli]WQE15449.1 sigma-54-dependent Fis family transcriptional regulator [Trinickia caryophylli]SMF68513.1 regulatory protein, Fis family [Trinickia caryophylli]
MAQLPRISLADVARIAGTVLCPAGSDRWSADSQPTLADISECVYFSPGDGRIWLNDQRMLLLHSRAMGTLRRELIDSLGIDKARGLLTRSGYVSGAHDARLVRERWSDADPSAIFVAGTRLHTLEGVVKVVPVSFSYNPESGRYRGEFLWHNSSEDDEHLDAYGVGTSPACWLELGYAIGYVSTLLGHLVIFREVECRSMGAAVCRVIGQSAELWDDASEDLRYLNAQDFVGSGMLAASVPVATAPGVGPEPAPGPSDGARSAQEERGANESSGPALVGASSAFNAACHLLRRVAPTDATVLFTGESGVGKERFARMLHQISRRQDKPFVAINCAAIPETLVEAELFGVERGAYTGATHSRAGRFELAHEGTLFLDEIGTLSLVAQGKLLRALQEGELERVGSSATRRVNTRAVAATNEDLLQAVREGRFRQDLFFRLNVFPIHLPPLRERRDDIPLLMSHFLKTYAHKHGLAVRGFTPRAIKALLNYSFPGNIRELQNLVERGVILAQEGLLDLSHMFISGETLDQEVLSLAIAGEVGTLAREEGRDEGLEAAAPPSKTLLDLVSAWSQRQHGSVASLPVLEQTLLEEAVERAGGNLSSAARALGITRAQLAYRLQRRAAGNGDH